ncbi:MAG: hypothetical protein V1936_03955 [Patescibacteria group bacterium]
MNFYFLILGAITCYVLGDFLAKVWSLQKGLWIAAALGAYFLGSLFFTFAIKKESLSLAVATAPIAIALTGLLLGYFYFGERLSVIQYLGAGLGLIALTLLLFPFQIFAK